MTKEELDAQKEIEEYFTESAGFSRDKVQNFMDIVNKALKQKGERIAELEKEKCELLGIIQGKDEAIKDLRDNYEQYKAVAEPEIAALKNEIVNLKGVIESLSEQRDRLEKENAELKEQNANLIAMLKSEREVRVNDDYLKGVCEKEAEIGKLEGKVQDWTSEYYELENFMNNKLDEAKKIIKDFVDRDDSCWSIQKRAEEFLKECQ